MHTFKLFTYLASYFGLIFIFREKFKTENEASDQESSPLTRQPDGVTGDVQEESKDRGTVEKVNTEEKISPEESEDILPVAGVSSEDCGREEEDEDQTLFTTSDKVDQELIESDIQFSTDKDISQSELDNTSLLLSQTDSMRDVCADELKTIEHGKNPPIQEQENPLAGDEIRDTSDINQRADTEKVRQEFPYSGLADVDVCAEELQQTDKSNVVDDDLNARTTKEEDLPGGFSLSQNRTQTASLQDMEPQEMNTLENQELIETHLDTHELVLSTEDAVHHTQEMENILDTDAAPQEEALVEINFDDVPEVHTTVETEDQQLGDEGSVVEQSEQRPQSQLHEDIIGARSGHGEDGVQNIDEPTSETDGQEKEEKAEREEIDDHDAADISMEMDTRDLALGNNGYEGGLNETILSSKPSAELTNLELKTDFDNDHETDNEDASEVENRGNKDSERLNTHNETDDQPEDTIDDEKTHTQGLSSEMEEGLPSEFDDGNAGIRSNESKPEKEPEEEAEVMTVEENPVEMKEIALAPAEPQPEDTMEEIEDAVVMPQTSGAEDRAEEVVIDDQGQGRSNAVGEGSIESYHLSAGRTPDDINHGEQRPPETENDVVEPETKDEDKVTSLLYGSVQYGLFQMISLFL